MQPNNNRPPDQADHRAGTDAGDGAFEPGVSFTNNPSDQEGSGELPSWLQNFADVASESSGASQPGAPASPGERESMAPDANPEQSRPSQTQPPAKPARPAVTNVSSDPFGQGLTSGDTGFLSEDDLPDWLRALSTDSESTPSVASPVTMSSAAEAPDGALQVPLVGRAWATATDQPEVSSGANLLSSLVHVIDSRPDSADIEPVAAVPSPSHVAGAGAIPQPAAKVAATEATASEAGSGSRKRLLMIAAIIILVLIAVVLLFGN